ncbi:MAG: DUF805 domain-containing protein [Verrucomicrobiota bacterium]
METSFMSSEGRINRLVYAIRLALLLLLTAGITAVAMKFFSHWHHGTFYTLGIFVGIVTAMLCGLVGLMQMLKRLRDMGKEAYMTIWLLVPGVNLLLVAYTIFAPSKGE